MMPRESLILRPAAYAILVHQGKLLLLKMRQTGKYHLPGGGIQVGERMEETLKREVKEEAGIEIEVKSLVYFEEVFFYYDPSRKAYHGLHFHFICQPKTFELLRDDCVQDDSAGNPRWVEIQELQAQDFQIHGEVVLEIARTIVET